MAKNNKLPGFPGKVTTNSTKRISTQVDIEKKEITIEPQTRGTPPPKPMAETTAVSSPISNASLNQIASTVVASPAISSGLGSSTVRTQELANIAPVQETRPGISSLAINSGLGSATVRTQELANIVPAQETRPGISSPATISGLSDAVAIAPGLADIASIINIGQPSLELPIISIRTITLDGANRGKTATLRFSFNLPVDEENMRVYEVVPDSMKVKIVQINNDKMFSFLNLSKELVFYSASSSKISSLPQILLNIAKETGLTRTSTGLELTSAFKDPKNIKHFTFDINSMEAIARREEVGKINMEYEVKIPFESDTKHLSFYIYPELDQQKMREAGINVDTSTTNIKVNSEIVLNAGKKIPQTYALYLRDNSSRQKINWNGFYHYDTNSAKWLTGKPTDDNDKKRVLSREIFFNTKIRDRTVFDSISKMPKYINNKPLRKITEVVSPVQFGNITQEGNTFFINTELLLEKFSSLYDYMSSVNADNPNIVGNVKVFRKRVKEVLGRVRDFKQNQPKEYLKSSQVFLDKSKTINKITVLEEDVGIGKYCYGIELTVRDILKKEMEFVLGALEKNNNFLAKYLEQANIKDINYDFEKNKFTQTFQIRYEKETQIVKSVEVYIEALLRVSSITSFPQEMKKDLLLQISPKYGNPAGINNFISLYEKLIGFYSSAIKNASNNGFFNYDIYFDKIEQVVEYKRTILNTQNKSLYQNFFSENYLSVKKEINEKQFVRISNNEVWDNMLEKNKNDIVRWINFTKQTMETIPYKTDNEKYNNALKVLDGLEINDRKTTTSNTNNISDMFYIAQKSIKEIIQEDLSSIYISISETPKNNSTGNVSELKVTEIMSNISKMNRKK